jgi:hypothetical protein
MAPLDFDRSRDSPVASGATVELLAAVRRGDESAPAQLVERCLPPTPPLARTSTDDHDAVIGRPDLQYDDDLTVAPGIPSASAARKAVTRAMTCLAEEMRHG